MQKRKMALTTIYQYVAVIRYPILITIILVVISLCILTKNAVGQSQNEEPLYGQKLFEKMFGQTKKADIPKPEEGLKLKDLKGIVIPAVLVIFLILIYITFAGRRHRYVIKKKGGTFIVIDGDTFWSKRHNNKIRICGIDCPEKGEPGYQEAKDFLYELLNSGSLRIKKKGIDKYGRILAEVFVNGEDIALKIKEKGLDKLGRRYKQRFLGPIGVLSTRDKEEYRCEACNRRISKEEYHEFNGLCRWCRGAPTQRGFPSPPGFPKPF